MLMDIALAIIVLVVALLAFAATRPGSMHIERSARIKAPASRIFPLICDFRRWEGWSPYERLDPAMKKTYSGASSGTGAVYEWAGNNKAGQGRMEMTDVSDPSRVTIQLDFMKPFEGHNIAQFTLAPDGDATKVTWAMDGQSPFMMKVMGIFVNMDEMLGKDFETGLANLRAATEKP
jgi:carbon monoxide dehydrogenase subunit G